MTRTDPLVGTTFAGLRVDGVAGRGGMAVVYRAEHLTLGRVVALKVISESYSDDPVYRAYFAREARAAGGVDHPHVLPVHHGGEHDGRLYLVTKWIDGEDLEALLTREGPLDPPRAARIVAAVAAGLDAAHAKGLVHRDVKPANVMLGDDGGVYLADFGIARPVGGPAVTTTGQLVGTVDYIAPEQAQGRPVDQRGDVYALGGVLHRMLTGRVPYPDRELPAILFAHCNAPPPRPSAERPGVPPGIDAVVARAMAKDADDRYPSAGAFAAAAVAALGTTPAGAAAGGRHPRREAGTTVRTPAAAATPPLPTSPPPAPARRRRRLAAVAAATAVTAIGAFAVGAALRDDGQAAGGAERVRAGALSVAVPGDWATGVERRVPGVTFRDPIVRTPPGSDARTGLIAGMVEAGGDAALPAGLAEAAGAAAAEPQVVRLETLEAERHAGLAPEGFGDDLITALAVPTAAGTALALCHAPPESDPGFRDECERVAATMRLSGTTALPVGPDPAFAEAVRGSLTAMHAPRAAARAALARAPGAPGQAAAARRLVDVYADARARIAGAARRPADRRAVAMIRAAMADASRAYADLATASTAFDSAGHAAASRAVRNAEDRLRGALESLGALGYRVTSP